jgi:starvation-inducible DNA-binding protein
MTPTTSPKKQQRGAAAAASPRRTAGSPAEFQAFGSIVRLPNSLSEKACQTSVKALNQVLADTITLRDLYKKHHWQVSGPTFIQLHELYDKHFEQQAALVDQLAERIQLLGGVSVAMAADVAAMTKVDRPPMGREPAPNQISRQLAAHEIVLSVCHGAMDTAEEQGDDGTSDLLVDVIRANEFQVWFLAQHLVPTPIGQEPARDTRAQVEDTEVQ